MEKIDSNVDNLAHLVQQVYEIADEQGESDFMKTQEKETAKKFNLKQLEEQSEQINEAYDILKTPREG